MRVAATLPALVLLLLLLASAAAPAAAASRGRAVLQSDALSNSNGCLSTIPKCESGACATRNIMGVARWVCLRCATNYEPVVDASGQDNIIQCVCPKGTFEDGAGAASCTRCPANAYCPGGDKVENPTSRGAPVACGANLITRSDGARSQTDCVARAGYALTSPSSGTACNTGEYAPPLNRLAKCLRCQSGLAEAPASGLADGQRSSKRAVCKIPPGKYVSQGLVRICPQGFYRENWVDFDAAVGTICLPCNPGITTDGAGAGSVSLCNKVLPGYGISNVVNVTGPADIPALPSTNGTGLPNATLCDIGFYSLGGRCAQCPRGTVTTAKGAKSIEECVVPPGYFLSAAAMPQCANGTFREGWVMYSDPKAAACTPCGTGISSEPRDLDAHPLAQNGSLVRATSASCYIEAGMGMIAQGKNLFVGQDCPINTYGAAGKVYGWAAAPCKPCPRNMITDGATRVNNSDVCINDDGFGYASEGASRCAPGFYSAKGSRRPCHQCPSGRNTSAVAAKQRTITDCFVRPGSGIVRSTGAGGNGSSGGNSSAGPVSCTDAFSPDVAALDSAGLTALPVLECPVGYYGAGMSVGAKCLQCPDGSSTEAPGAASEAACNVCVAGRGRNATTSSGACGKCPFGSYQPGGLTQCSQCDSARFFAPVDGAGPAWTSSSTTLFQGAFDAAACVPQASQLSPEAGQAYFAPDSPLLPLLPAATQQASLGDCLAASPAGSCSLVQFSVNTQAGGGACRTAALAPADAGAGASGLQLMVKLPPSALGAASSVNTSAKSIASGFYAACGVPAASAAAWQAGAGSGLGVDARTFSTNGTAWDTSSRSRAKCQARCDQSNVCWGFFFDVASAACLYRGGVDALATRSLFVLPTAVDLESLDWAPAPAASTCSVAPGGVVQGGNSTSNGASNSGSPGTQQGGTAPNAGNTTSNSTSNTTTAPTVVSIITTIAGTTGTLADRFGQGDGGPANQTLLSNVMGVVQDAAGNLYYSDSGTACIKKLDPATGVQTNFAGTGEDGFSGDGGPAAAAKLSGDVMGGSLAIDDARGWLYYADYGNGVVRRISLATGTISTVAGTPGQRGFAGDGGQATAARMSPNSLAVDARNGDLYVSDLDVPRVRKVSFSTGGGISLVAGNGSTNCGFGVPCLPGGSATASALNVIKGMDVDTSGNLYLAGQGQSVIYKVDAAGKLTVVAGQVLQGGLNGNGGLATAATLAAPCDVKVDGSGNLWIADCINRVVRRVDAATGIISTVVADPALEPYWGGPNDETLFDPPYGDGGPPGAAFLGGSSSEGEFYLCLGKTDGCMYIADTFLHSVRKVTYFDTLR